MATFCKGFAKTLPLNVLLQKLFDRKLLFVFMASLSIVIKFSSKRLYKEKIFWFSWIVWLVNSFRQFGIGVCSFFAHIGVRVSSPTVVPHCLPPLPHISHTCMHFTTQPLLIQELILERCQLPGTYIEVEYRQRCRPIALTLWKQRLFRSKSNAFHSSDKCKQLITD